MTGQSGNGILEEFRLEFLDCWKKLPNKGFFVVLFCAWLVLFHFIGSSTLGYVKEPSLFSWMHNAYAQGAAGVAGYLDSENSFGVLVPFVVVLLLWLKRRELMNLPLTLWPSGLWVLALGLFMHTLGFVVQQPRISVLGFYTGLYGLGGIAWGRAWFKASFFPCFLFVFAVPLNQLAAPITFRLQMLVSRLVELICHFALAIDIVREGNLIKDPTGRYQYEVAAACSGIRSLMATVALATVIGFWSFRSWWKRIVIIASAFPLAVLGNLLRMLSIVIAGEIGGQKAGEYVHEGGPMGLFSLLPYALAFVGLLALESWLYERRSAPVRQTSLPAQSPQA